MRTNAIGSHGDCKIITFFSLKLYERKIYDFLYANETSKSVYCFTARFVQARTRELRFLMSLNREHLMIKGYL